MKIFAVVTLSAFLANFAVSACCEKELEYLTSRQCNIRKFCPKSWKCWKIPGEFTGICKEDDGIDYNRANHAFTSADADHDRKLTVGGAYKALHSLVPGASEQMLNKLTKSGDRNKDGYASYSEFLNMYLVLVKLTKSERAQVKNIFNALNTNKDKGVSRQEFNKLLLAVRQTMGHDTILYSEVQRYIKSHSDTNHDKTIEYSEFLKACQTLKAKDIKSFPVFLKSATKLKPLGPAKRPTAALKSRCHIHRTCKPCVAEGRHKLSGAVCVWTTDWGGHTSCQPTSGSNKGLATSTTWCPNVLVVHGRE